MVRTARGTARSAKTGARFGRPSGYRVADARGYSRRRSARVLRIGPARSQRLFLPHTSQHVARAPRGRDWVAGLAMLGAAASWAIIAALLAG